MPRPRALPSIALTLALSLGAGAASASPEDVIGFGPRASAMGATGAADAAGYEAVYGNPALLSLARRRQLAVGITGAVFDLRARRDGSASPGAARVSYEPLRGSVIGAVLPVPFGGALQDRIAIGLGFFTPFDLVVRGRILYPERLQFPIADRTQSVAIQAGIGVDLGYGLRLGGGFAALAALSGTVLVATDSSGRIGTTVDDTLVASYGPIVGASFDFLDAWRVGLTFRGPLKGQFNVVITVKDLGDLTVPPLNISGMAQYDPWQIALEVARVKGPWRVAIGATYKHWSAYPGLAEATVRCPTTDPMTGQPFTDTCAAATPAPPGYHDTVVPRVGVERAFDLSAAVELRVRGGFFFEPSPAPMQRKEGNVFDNHRAALTLGAGVELGPPAARFTLDVFGQMQSLLSRDHVKEAAVAPANPGAPLTTTSGVIGAFGAALGVMF